MIDANLLEERVLEMMVRQLKDNRARYLREQIRSARVVKRTFTGVGFFTEIEVPETCTPVPGEPRFHLSGVSGAGPKLQHGIGFVLLVERGRLRQLEGFTYDEPWPADLGEIALAYAPEGAGSAEPG